MTVGTYERRAASATFLITYQKAASFFLAMRQLTAHQTRGMIAFLTSSCLSYPRTATNLMTNYAVGVP